MPRRMVCRPDPIAVRTANGEAAPPTVVSATLMVDGRTSMYWYSSLPDQFGENMYSTPAPPTQAALVSLCEPLATKPKVSLIASFWLVLTAAPPPVINGIHGPQA